MIPTAADRAPSHPENAPVAPFGSGKNVNTVGSGPDTYTSEEGGRAAHSNQQVAEGTQPKQTTGEPSGRERAGLGGSTDGAAGGGGGQK